MWKQKEMWCGLLWEECCLSMIRRRSGKILRSTEYPFKSAARVFFDYDRIELYGEAHSGDEDR